MTVPEKKEEAGRYKVKKGCTCTTQLWSRVHYHLTELFIIHWELLIFFGEMSHLLLQGYELLRLSARYWLGAPKG
jgi:hypothetical protein